MEINLEVHCPYAGDQLVDDALREHFRDIQSRLADLLRRETEKATNQRVRYHDILVRVKEA